jgi:CheY-like chemotaxis protein/anti-sigma regulatory factor (Ser/Thr protein kinase)
VRLKQIVTNLTSNAIKFTDQGEVRIDVAFLGGPAAQPEFQITVTDTGVGFDPANKDRVFGRFQQADGSITRRFGGTGLGLAISRQLAELMEGELDCDSAPGVGSKFWVRLPLAITEAPVSVFGTAGEAASTTVDPAEEGQRALRVLLADDHPTNRKVVELILQPLGVELVSVEDGRQAVDAFASGGFDIVLMDMQMPVMDGVTATREMRRDSRLASLPIIAMTANAMEQDRRACRAAGMDAFVSKPFDPEEFLATVARCVAAGARQDADFALSG